VKERPSSSKALLGVALLAAVLLVVVFLTFGDAWIRWFPSK
jgi:hypothetical protein